MAMLVLAAAGGLFAALAIQVATAGPLTRLDTTIATWFHLHATPQLTALMVVVSDLHRPLAVDALACLAALVLWRNRAPRFALATVITVVGGLAANGAWKYAIHRARPAFENPIVVLDTFSFPSGHTLGATLLYGMLAAFLLPRLHSMLTRALLAATVLFMIALVATSRLYLGAHYLSDVLGAFCEGVVWIELSMVVLSRIGAPRTNQPENTCRSCRAQKNRPSSRFRP